VFGLEGHSSNKAQIRLFYLFLFSSRLYCRPRNVTGSAKRLAGFTAGREFHPTPEEYNDILNLF